MDLSKLNEGDNSSSNSGAVRSRAFNKKKREASSDSEITPPRKITVSMNKNVKKRVKESSDES